MHSCVESTRWTRSASGLRASIFLGCISLVAALSGCQPDAPKAPASAPNPAPQASAPPQIPEPDTSTATYDRASSPTLQPVVLGKFKADNPAAESATGAIDIEDGKITGVNGASFNTERVALVSGDDQYSAGKRYADAMMIEPRQQVELRHVVSQTPPKDSGQAFCGATDTGYLALSKVTEGDHDVVKLIALGGDSLPAQSAENVSLCATAVYQSGKH